jgi:hypothetical protein
MEEVAFSIPVTGTIRIQGNSVVIKISESAITMKLDMTDLVGGKLKLERGKTLFDIVLETAKSWVVESGTSQFTAAQLYHMALDKYPSLNLKRNSWGAHVIASAPDHPSYGNYTSKRNYFTFMGRGLYRLSGCFGLEDTSA